MSVDTDLVDFLATSKTDHRLAVEIHDVTCLELHPTDFAFVPGNGVDVDGAPKLVQVVAHFDPMKKV